MKVFLKILLLSIALCSVCGNEIRICLNSGTALKPLYLGELSSPDHSYTPKELTELRQVLVYDLNYNGETVVMPTQDVREQALNRSFDPAPWKQWGVAYLVKAIIRQNALLVTVMCTRTGDVKQFPPVTLTHQLSQDRKRLHRLSDAIHKSLFGAEGIAQTRILYAVKQKSESGRYISEIWCCDWDGANPRQLTHHRNYSITPVAVPFNSRYNSDQFLYVSYQSGPSKIFLASMNGAPGHRIVPLRGNQLLPAISPQRDKIAFISDVDGHSDLFLQPLNTEGKPIQLFSFPRSTQASPTFSPDGSQIAFVSDKDGSPRIYIISAIPQSRRATPLMITKRNSENSCPAWSPDGKKIAYSGKTKGVRQIWIYDVETGEEKQLTEGATNKENPSWARNSRHLTFNSTDGHRSELYVVNLNQPDAIQISSGFGVKHYPSWGS